MELKAFIEKYRAEVIKSKTNPKIISWSKLSEKKYRDSLCLFAADGIKLAQEALLYADVQFLAVSEKAVLNDIALPAADEAARLNVQTVLLPDPTFEKITDEKAPQGVVAIVKYSDKLHKKSGFAEWQRGKRLIMLNEIRDPGNLGTILRSAEAFGAGGAILSGCADIYNKKTVRAAMGTLFRFPLYITSDGVECAKIMKESGRRVIAATLGDNTLTLGEYEINLSDCTVIGNEGHGISKDLLNECTAYLRIPMAGKAESLNAASAATCVLWEYFRKQI